MAAVTQGRNDGRKNRTPAKTMTSESQDTAKTGVRRTEKQLPTVYIERKNGPVDILDTGLEDHQWHYVWVSVNDPVGLSSYYNDGYRFVRFEDVKQQFAEDELRQFLYTEDVAGRVQYGDENRLMRIPQQVFKARINAALNTNTTFSAVEKAKQLMEAGIEQGKYDGSIHSSARVSADDDAGNTEQINLDGGNE